MRTLLCMAFAAALLYAHPALAFEPDPGNRAYPLTGHDMLSGKQISLEDYRGQWVLLQFWASW